MKRFIPLVMMLAVSIVCFSQQPNVKSFSPSGGSNGTSIIIKGENFIGVTAVTFGGVAAKSFTVDSASIITAIVGTGASGSVAVVTAAGTATLNGFSYGELPTIVSFTPVTGQKATVVTITGTNFTGATAVSFGDVAASSFNVVSATSITAVVSANGASGSVSVTTPIGSTSLAGFTYTGPKISSITPNSGGTGSTIKIRGINFTGVTAVSFGGEAASSFTIDSSTVISAKVGKVASGLVSVTSSAGTATFDGFTHTGPRISSFTPKTGTAGTVVTITGSNFGSKNDSANVTVSFGGIAARSFTIDSTTRITAVVGTGASGTLSVTTSNGTAGLSGFTFAIPTSVISFSPITGTNGTTVKITGTNFTGTTAVNFGGVAAKSFTVDSVTGITAVVGAGATGNVAVATPNGAASKDGFTYTGPIITSFSPLGGTNGTTITIKGSNLTGATAVRFGGTAARSFTVDSATSITAVVGTGASGAISVTTSAGTATIDGFTYGNPPTITSYTPTSGKSGTTITITGTNLSTTNIVSFGGTLATSFSVLSSTSVTAVVGLGSSGNVSLTTLIGTITATGFVHTGPTITSFTPTSGTNGTSVKILGTNFTGATAVSFGGVAAKSFTVDSSKGITAVVGAGANGSVSVTTPNGTITLAGFTHTAPTISSFTPSSATTDGIVKITGTNFTGVTSITFGGIAAKSFTIDSVTKITAVVGTGASGVLSVTTASGSAGLNGFTYLRPAPTVSFTGSKSFCAGGSLLLTSSELTNNQWYKNGVALNGDTNRTYLASASGTYTVKTNISNVLSVASAGVVITVNPLPVARFTIKESEQC